MPSAPARTMRVAANTQRPAFAPGVALYLFMALALLTQCAASAFAAPVPQVAPAPDPGIAVFAASSQIETVAHQPATGIPALTSAVIDTAGVLDAGRRAAIERRIVEFEQRGSQLQVLVLPTTGNESIESYALRAFNTWKLGRKDLDDGLLLVVATDDRRARIEVGYGLEGAIPDVTAGRVLDEYVIPRFRDDDYGGGIEAGVEKLIALAQGESLPPPAHPREMRGMGLLAMLLVALSAGAAAGLRWLRWPWAVAGAVAGCALASALTPGPVAGYVIASPWMLVTGYPIGYGLVRSRTVRLWAAGAAGLAVVLALLGLALGYERLMIGLGLLVGLGVVAAMLWVPWLLAREERKDNPTGFRVRIGIILGVLGLGIPLILSQTGVTPIALIVLGFASYFFTVLVLGIGSDESGGGGGRSDDDRDDRSDRSSSSSSSRSGGGGSSGGGGASRSW